MRGPSGGGAAPNADATLLLFDIDGTLVRGANRAHAAALRDALRRVHGIDADAVRLTIAPAGRTDGEIARMILLGAGIDARRIDERAAQVRTETCRRFAALVEDDLSEHIVPGVAELLAELSDRSDVRLALLTGNFEPIARLKLRRAGNLGRWFPSGQGAFGSDDEDRLVLPEIARRRAGSVGLPHPREQTVIIGDTPRDIACAHADGLRCVAVATGPHPAADLGAADTVVESPGDLRAALLSWL